MGTANNQRPPEPPPFDPSQEWMEVGQGEITTDKWPLAVGVVRPSRWMLCIRADGAVLRWSFAPIDGSEIPTWTHDELPVAQLAHHAHRRHLTRTAA